MSMASVAAVEDDLEWAKRNQFWQDARRPTRTRNKRERRRDPLILCGHGVRLRIDRDSLLIDDGFTHYPQERQTYRYFKGDLELPPRIIMLDGSGGLSFDVIRWLSEQHVPLITLDYQGEAISVIGGSGFAMSADKVQWQIETRNDPERRLAFSGDLILAKLTTSLATLNSSVPESPARTVALAATEHAMRRIEAGNVGTVDELRMIEAQAAASYSRHGPGCRSSGATAPNTRFPMHG